MVGRSVSTFDWAKEDQHVTYKISRLAALASLGLLGASIAKPADAQTWHDVRANITASTVTILSGDANGKLTATN